MKDAQDEGEEGKDQSPIDWEKAGRPCMGERVSGDIALAQVKGKFFFAAMVDVLGHGPEAHEDSLVFANAISKFWSPDLATVFARVSKETAGGRGAAVSLACLEIDTGALQAASVGNTAIRLVSPSAHTHAVATDGIVGQQFRSPIVQQFTLEPNGLVLMYSDGVEGGFSPSAYPQMSYQSAGAVARTLVRKHSKSYDDATALVFRFAR